MPGHEERMSRWDALPAAEAAARAWLDPGRKFGTWHSAARTEISYLMPMLARALDRLVIECEVYPVDPLLWEDVVPPTVPTPRKRLR